MDSLRNIGDFKIQGRKVFAVVDLISAWAEDYFDIQIPDKAIAGWKDKPVIEEVEIVKVKLLLQEWQEWLAELENIKEKGSNSQLEKIIEDEAEAEYAIAQFTKLLNYFNNMDSLKNLGDFRIEENIVLAVVDHKQEWNHIDYDKYESGPFPTVKAAKYTKTPIIEEVDQDKVEELLQLSKDWLADISFNEQKYLHMWNGQAKKAAEQADAEYAIAQFTDLLEFMTTGIKTPRTHPEHSVVGRYWNSSGIEYYCDSYDPRIGYWMTPVEGHPLEDNWGRQVERRNISERAPHRTWHLSARNYQEEDY